MSSFYRSLEYIGIKINRAINTKQSIITAANSYEYIMKKVKEIEENSLKKIEEEKVQNMHFEPNEIEPIILKSEDEKYR